MLVISEAQMAGIETAVRQRQIRRVAQQAAARLSAAGAPRRPEEFLHVAEEVQRFAEARGLVEEDSLHTLLALRLLPQWREPLPSMALMLLEREGFEESVRVEQFRQALLQPRFTLIDLDAPLPLAPR